MSATPDEQISAANHHRRGMGTANNNAFIAVTKTTFAPSNGVATETSPLLSAAKAQICPAKNTAAWSKGCHNGQSGRAGSSKVQTGSIRTASATFTTKLTWLALAPRTRADFKKMAPRVYPNAATTAVRAPICEAFNVSQT